MAYGIYNGIGGYGQPYPAVGYAQPRTTYPLTGTAVRPGAAPEIMRVNGEAGARNVRLAPNGGVLRLDETAPLLWVIQADGAGYTTATPFTITQYRRARPVDVNDLENRVKKLEEIINDQSGVERVAKRKSKPAAADEE